MKKVLERVFSCGRKLSIDWILQHGQLLFYKGNYAIVLDEVVQEFDYEVKDLISQTWINHLRVCPKDFNGSLLSVENIGIYDNSVRIVVRPSDFSTYFSTHSFRPRVIDLDCNPIDKGGCMPLSVGCVAITSPTKDNPNGCLIFAERKETTFEDCSLTLLPGGYLEIGDIINPDNCLLEAIKRESLEEIGVSDALLFQNLGIIYSDVSRQPLIALRMLIAETKEELIEKIKESNEVKKITFIDNNFNSIRNSNLPLNFLAVHDAWKLCLHLST